MEQMSDMVLHVLLEMEEVYYETGNVLNEIPT